MKKNYLLIASAVLVTTSVFVFYHYQQPTQKIYNTQEVTEIIDDIYADVSGFCIEVQERQLIENQGGNATYGEITVESVAQLLHDLSLTKNDLFYDLGSGVGKVCMQVALTTPARAIGIELSPTRCHGAQEIKKELIKRNILTDANKLQFFEQNITDVDLSKATAILLCSTCFSDELMNLLTNKMAAECKKGLRVLTLKDLPENNQFVRIKMYELPMSWSQASQVYLYALEKN